MAKKTRVKASKEITQQTAIVNIGPSTLPEGIKLIKRITLPSLAIKEPGSERILYIQDEIRTSAVPGKKNADGTVDKPAHICAVGDVMTGEAFTFIVPAVVQANLERDYPNADYIGKVFRIKNCGKRKPGQRYNDFIIDEVDASGLQKSAAAA